MVLEIVMSPAAKGFHEYGNLFTTCGRTVSKEKPRGKEHGAED